MNDHHSESAAQTRSLNVAEYVLGTLDEHSRAQIDKALDSDAGLRQELDYWQQRLGPLCLAVACVEPPTHVWQSICEKTRLDVPTTDAIGTGAGSKLPATQRGARFWPGLAVAASVVAVVLAALLFNTSAINSSAVAADPAYASVVYDEPTGMSWLVTGSAQPDMFSVTAMGQFPLPQGKILRAWLKPEHGPAVFLGPWPYTPGEHSLSVPASAADKLARASRLMVTMENANQAVGPAPNGRVMWVSPVARHTG